MTCGRQTDRQTGRPQVTECALERMKDHNSTTTVAFDQCGAQLSLSRIRIHEMCGDIIDLAQPKKLRATLRVLEHSVKKIPLP